MLLQAFLIVTLASQSWSKPGPKPTPISIYQQQQLQQQPQQESVDEQDNVYQPQIQYRQQPVQYKQVPVQPSQTGRQQARALYRAQQQQTPQQLQQTENEDYEIAPPQPYQFSFDVNDDENTNYQNRKEQREGNKITGSYSVVDADGFVRTVTYTADPVEGFKAHVSREPTNIVVKFPTPAPAGEQPINVQYSPAPKQVQYAQTPSQPIVQYNGAPVPRGQAIRQPVASARQKQTQQYLQAIQSEAGAPIYSQGTVRHSQAVSTAGQINQFLAETSPNSAAKINQFSNSNTASLRG